ncbi:MAG: helix-turn-helix domain-containing protein [Xenococcaceae cyanobacterium]
MTKETVFEESSGNIFADLGLEDADELMARAKLGLQILDALEERNLQQREIADLLGIKQSEVSLLKSGKFHRFSEGRLVGFLNKLNRKVIYQVSNHKVGEPLQDVVFVP